MLGHILIKNTVTDLTPFIDDTNIELFETVKNNLDHDKIQSLFIESCKRGALMIAKELLKSNFNIDIHSNNEEAFRFACVQGHLEIAQWLWQLDGNTNIHADNEYAFKHACKFGKLEVAQWLWGLDQNINIHANNEFAFVYACFGDHLEVAQWLSTICNDYLIAIDNGEILEWLIKDENCIILELIENNNYNEAIIKLNIKSTSTKHEHKCMVCLDKPSEIIELPCHHTLCLESIVRFGVANHSTKKKCFYCQKEYQWDQCQSLKKIEP